MIHETLQKTQAAHEITITGRRRAMVPFGLRLPKEDAAILTRTARRNRCKGADLLRTAWLEYIEAHGLREALA